MSPNPSLKRSDLESMSTRQLVKTARENLREHGFYGNEEEMVDDFLMI